MDNKTIYRKTLGFSLRRLFWDFFSIVLVLGISTLGFFIAEKVWSKGLIGLAIGAVVGLIIALIVLRFVSYKLKAGQIAMMTRGITEGELPDDVIGEGKRVVKERFLTVAAYFAVTGAIKGIFRQIGRGITRLGESIGGDTGGAIGGAINGAIQTVISYLSDCCLGWVFYRKDVKAGKATCEGAVLFFKHGKTFIKNMGRVALWGIGSLVIIGGVFGGAIYLILSSMSGLLEGFYNEVAELFAKSSDAGNSLVKILQDPNAVPIVFAVIGGLLIWGFIHSVFIRPYVLVGVLRNYIESGKDEVPSEESFGALDSKSKKFKKLHDSL
ncbi:MAG: hypothetical protein IKZ81_02865 [Clostridia bacterium]|nr:hypothetical protein [Clostridia bacterium]MBR5769608.1 hypothetical protein [Clostridia bacterium]MBR5942261.1 hypothetical protein [Clostridia bacterium]